MIIIEINPSTQALEAGLGCRGVYEAQVEVWWTYAPSYATSQVKALENAEKERKYLKPCKVRLARLDPLDEHL